MPRFTRRLGKRLALATAALALVAPLGATAFNGSGVPPVEASTILHGPTPTGQ